MQLMRGWLGLFLAPSRDERPWVTLPPQVQSHSHPQGYPDLPTNSSFNCALQPGDRSLSSRPPEHHPTTTLSIRELSGGNDAKLRSAHACPRSSIHLARAPTYRPGISDAPRIGAKQKAWCLGRKFS